ncbi:MAG: Short-chain dehydrogenase/reductase SDR [Candidatus Amesbacteria bacterium GW2011_GWA2_42_12]|uniref:Short-chain dehydrogenase/reductase SDR n=1 Tax=Candidatus Amesbacteria bacterium GW2011_GWA2_42_12 TaxID=1618356 RepID=A0A0G0Y5N1_9BACT|nr:MAG: Short-chain dehydrogenase/reductase SDR [Candidatus Amesbacteria bacterium GW2011_GWA2_42_12]
MDVLVNVAGIWHGKGEVYAGKSLENFDQKVILDTYTVGFTAPILLVHGLLPLMSKGSSIVNISGTFENGARGWLPYFASKRALEDFTLGLVEELTDMGIRVNCVSPSDTATEEYKKYFPEDAKDANQTEDVARLICETAESGESGKFVGIKNGKRFDKGFHK